jgi:hypothetical protein
MEVCWERRAPAGLVDGQVSGRYCAAVNCGADLILRVEEDCVDDGVYAGVL